VGEAHAAEGRRSPRRQRVPLHADLRRAAGSADRRAFPRRASPRARRPEGTAARSPGGTGSGSSSRRRSSTANVLTAAPNPVESAHLVSSARWSRRALTSSSCKRGRR